MTSRRSEGCKVVMEEVVEAVLRKATGVSSSASDSSSEDVTQMEDNFYGVITQAPRECRRHMLKTNANPSKLDFLVGCTSARHAHCPV
jgi:hypothetical protein